MRSAKGALPKGGNGGCCSICACAGAGGEDIAETFGCRDALGYVCTAASDALSTGTAGCAAASSWLSLRAL